MAQHEPLRIEPTTEGELGSRPPLSDRAREVITRLQKKPDLLREVARHFGHGWPTKQLVGPWTVITLPQGAVMGRLPYGTTNVTLGVGGVEQFQAKNYTGDQWTGTALTPADDQGNMTIRRRVFDTMIDAICWVDAQLTDAGFLLDRPVSKDDEPLMEPAVVNELLTAMRDYIAAKEAVAKAEQDDEIPF